MYILHSKRPSFLPVENNFYPLIFKYRELIPSFTVIARICSVWFGKINI